MVFLTITLSFVKDTFDIKAVEGFTNPEKIGFQPKLITSATIGIFQRRLSKEKLINFFQKNLDEPLDFTLHDHQSNCNSFGVVTPLTNKKVPQIIKWNIEYKNFGTIPYKDFLINPNFVFGYCCDSNYYIKQNTEFLNNLKAFNIDTKNLKKKFSFREFRWKIDTTDNPGVLLHVTEAELVSSWTMWFGNLYFEKFGGYVSRKELLTYSDAYKIEELSSGVICVQLYENPFDSDSKENYRKLQDFKKIMKFKKIYNEDENKID